MAQTTKFIASQPIQVLYREEIYCALHIYIDNALTGFPGQQMYYRQELQDTTLRYYVSIIVRYYMELHLDCTV